MAADFAALRARAPAVAPVLARVAAAPATAALLAIVGLSIVARSLASLLYPTPRYFPDEYLYAALARSLAESGRLEIRGHAAHFPAILQPLLSAPFWVAGDPALAYRLTQGLNAFAMSLAAVPVYLLARRLELGTRLALVCAGLAVACPALRYVPFATADAVAYPLALGAVYAGVCALERPRPRVQLAFVALCGLAALARIQYLVIPVAFLVAAVIVYRGAIHRLARDFTLTLGIVAVVALGSLTLGPTRLLGIYGAVPAFDVEGGAVGRSSVTHAMLFAYAAGWVVVPGALVGLAVAAVWPRARAEAAFAALALALGAGLFAQAALYATNVFELFHERYLIALLPLVPLAFGVYVKRGLPGRHVTALLALVLLAISAKVPVSAYTASTNKQESPFLLAAFELERRIGTGNGALAVALLAAALSALAAATAFRHRLAPVALGAALAAWLAVSVGATALDAHAAEALRRAGAEDLRWVDRAGAGRVSFVQTAGAPPGPALEQLFWNASIDEVLVLGAASPIDSFHSPRVTVAPDGRLVREGRAVSNAILLATNGVHAAFANAELLARERGFELWAPRGTARLAMLVSGRWRDGWLADRGDVTVWPERGGRAHGTLRFDVWAPPGAAPTPLRVATPDGATTLSLAPGERRRLVYRVFARGPWKLRWSASRGRLLPDLRHVSVRATAPLFERDGVAQAVAVGTSDSRRRGLRAVAPRTV